MGHDLSRAEGVLESFGWKYVRECVVVREKLL